MPDMVVVRGQPVLFGFRSGAGSFRWTAGNCQTPIRPLIHLVRRCRLQRRRVFLERRLAGLPCRKSEHILIPTNIIIMKRTPLCIPRKVRAAAYSIWQLPDLSVQDSVQGGETLFLVLLQSLLPTNLHHLQAKMQCLLVGWRNDRSPLDRTLREISIILS